MTIFNKTRLPKEIFQIDNVRMRAGWYSDGYFMNTVRVLQTLAQDHDYCFKAASDVPVGKFNNGDIIVEMQFFTRRKPFSLVAGIDEALAILEECTGYNDENGVFVNTFREIEIEAVHDGTFAYYAGDPLDVQPILKVRGRYRDFAHLETPILGAITEAARIATNVYNVLAATRGKDVLFFPARFAHYKLQALHGYAYSLAVKAYNKKHDKKARASVSTDDQGAWWGGKGGGTMAHGSIAAFLGNTSETTLQFARLLPLEIPRVALIDFHNDCIPESLEVMDKMFTVYWDLLQKGNKEEAEKYRLFGVRPDTSGNMRDKSLPPLGDKKLDFGVNPRLVWALRQAIDNAWKEWQLPLAAQNEAKQWCKNVKIVVTGGFGVKKINEFEDNGVPVDIYGVGSSLLENSSETGTNNDFTADIVKVKIEEQWLELSKTGRQSCSNPNLELVKICGKERWE